MQQRTGFAIVLSIVYLAGAAAFAFGTVLLKLFSCDENCSDRLGAPWWERPGAWQWTAILVLGLAAFLLSCVAVWFGLAGRREVALVAFFLGAAAALGCAKLIVEHAHNGGTEFLVLVVLGLLVGLGALALFPRRPARAPARHR